MIISKNIIAYFFPKILHLNLEKIENIFFKSGIEIEKHEKIISPSGIVYGYVESCEEMVGSEKLKITNVFVKSISKTLTIICGAINIKKGMKVVVAVDGAKIFNNKLIIKNKKINNYLSEGMICGYSELFESKILNWNKHFEKEIIELDSDWDCSKEFNAEDLNLNDEIFLLSIPTNRKDLVSCWSIANELKKNLFYIEGDCTFNNENLEKFKENSLEVQKIKSTLIANNFFHFKTENIWNCFCYLSFNLMMQKEGNKFFLRREKNEVKECISTTFGEKNFLYPKDLNFFFKYAKDFFYKKFGKIIELNLNSFEDKKLYNKNVFILKEKILSFFNKDDLFVQQIKEKLSVVGFKFKELEKTEISKKYNNKCVYEISFPSWRIDLQSEQDFLRELCVFQDINEICEKEICVKNVDFFKNESEFEINEKTRNFWINRGFLECYTYSLSNDFQVLRNNIWGIKDIHNIKNYNKITNSLKLDSLTELKEIIKNNYLKKNKLFPIFEIKKINEINNSYWLLNIVVPQNMKKFYLNESGLNYDFYDLKSFLVLFAYEMGLNLSYLTLKQNNNMFKSECTLEIWNKKTICGFFGFLKENFKFEFLGLSLKLKNFNLENNKIFHFEKQISVYPPCFKDISLLVENEKTNLFFVIKKILKVKHVVKCEVIDKYKCENNFSYLIQIKLQSTEKTLTKLEIEKSITEVKIILKDENISIR